MSANLNPLAIHSALRGCLILLRTQKIPVTPESFQDAFNAAGLEQTYHTFFQELAWPLIKDINRDLEKVHKFPK